MRRRSGGRKGGEGPTFDDFGGNADIVSRAKELITLPLLHHDKLATIGARPIKGVLFTGDPGTGKTVLAEIIANEANARFYEISGPQIFTKWVGESEELLRKIFEAARANQPSIVFLDEIDSAAPAREGAHEASRKVVGQLLALMDGFERDERTIVIATTNRPNDIDIALRRPGRFDWEIHFPYPTDDDREAILRVRAERLSTAGPLPHAAIAERTQGWSPAHLAQIWSEAALFAVDDDRDAIISEDYTAAFARVQQQRLDRQTRELRPRFRRVSEHLAEKLTIERDALKDGLLRDAALAAAGFGLDAEADVASPATSPAETERFLDAEFVAIYW